MAPRQEIHCHHRHRCDRPSAATTYFASLISSRHPDKLFTLRGILVAVVYTFVFFVRRGSGTESLKFNNKYGRSAGNRVNFSTPCPPPTIPPSLYVLSLGTTSPRRPFDFLMINRLVAIVRTAVES